MPRRLTFLVWVLSSFAPGPPCRAADVKPAEQLPKSPDVDFCSFDPKAKPEMYVLTLDKAMPDGQPLTFHIWRRGGKFGQAWGESPAAPAYCFVAMAASAGFYNLPPDCGLQLAGDKLTGTLYRGAGQRYAITATVNGAAISGSFKGALADVRKGRMTGEGKPADGTLKGQVLTEAELRAQNEPLAPKAAYPCWRNDGSGVGFETGKELVADPSLARIVWKCEDLVPPGYHEGINFGSRPCGIQTGHASPVLADGKIYLNYFVGSAGRDNDDKAGFEELWAKSDYVPREMVLKKIARVADQIAICIDAQTGQTIWKKVFLQDGPNISRGGSDSRHKLFGPSSKAASHLTACVGDGKFYFKGTGGVLYCLDAATGELLWKAGAWDKDARGASQGGGTDTCQFADGVVATCREGGLTGYDGRTGKLLWTLKGAVGGRQTHLRWVHQGKEFFITPRGQLVEPRTGNVLWTAEFPTAERGGVGGVMSVGEGYLLCGGADSIVCFRITPQEVKKLWVTKDYMVWREIHPVICKGHAYVRAVTLQGRVGSAAATYCIELETGKVVGKASGTKSFSSVIAGDGRIFNCNAALVLMQKADPKDFRDLKPGAGAPSNTVADVSMPIIIQGQPETTAIYADGRIFSRCFDGIECLDLRVKK